MMDWFWTLMLVIVAFLGMEVFAWYAHKYIMHGWGWRWHGGRLSQPAAASRPVPRITVACAWLSAYPRAER